MSIPQAILNVAEICSRQNLKDVILSPGSRNAPLILAFSRHPELNIKVIPDERSAAYIALGMAQNSDKPVILICTSGTSVLNYGPGVAEAYYSNTPLLIITADRPPEWIDQQDGQTIRQASIFGPHVKYSYNLPVWSDHKDVQWHIERIANDAINKCISGNKGPVHINVPLREPLYPETDQTFHYTGVKVIRYRTAVKEITNESWQKLEKVISKSSKPLILCGQFYPDQETIDLLNSFGQRGEIPILGDALSNLHHIPGAVRNLQVILGQSTAKISRLQPDLLITFGGAVISKNLKQFFRRYSPKYHWHIQPNGMAVDTFQSLTEVIEMEPALFLRRLIRLEFNSEPNWYQKWQQEQDKAQTFILRMANSYEFNELQAVSLILDHLPPCQLHVANSMPIRWTDLIGVPSSVDRIWANRGTSGIDGCNSTAVGHALSNRELQVLITGDMAFFYDRNAFWHNYALNNLKIIVLNNHGGGIFHLIEGPSNQPECEDLFVTHQGLIAQTIADEYGFFYRKSTTTAELKTHMAEVFDQQKQTAILEVECPDNMQMIYRQIHDKIDKSYE